MRSRPHLWGNVSMGVIETCRPPSAYSSLIGNALPGVSVPAGTNDTKVFTS